MVNVQWMLSHDVPCMYDEFRVIPTECGNVLAMNVATANIH